MSFIVTSVVWKEKQSRELGGSDEMVRVGVQALIVQCQQCGMTSRLTNIRGGGISPGRVGPIVTCPGCGFNEQVSMIDIARMTQA